MQLLCGMQILHFYHIAVEEFSESILVSTLKTDRLCLFQQKTLFLYLNKYLSIFKKEYMPTGEQYKMANNHV